MKKIAKFNPNIRNVGDVLTTSVAWGLHADVHNVDTHMTRSYNLLNAPERIKIDLPAIHKGTVELMPLILDIVRQLRPEGFVALHNPRSSKPIEKYGRAQTTFFAETDDGESVLHMIQADRYPHPILEKRGQKLYFVSDYYIYPDRVDDVIHREIQVFDSVSDSRLESYFPPTQETKSYPSLEAVEQACISYFGYEFRRSFKHSGETLPTVAVHLNKLITALGTLSTQAVLDSMRDSLVDATETLEKRPHFSHTPKLITVPTYPYEFIVDPSQRLSSPNPSQDDCELWELFVYYVKPGGLITPKVLRYTNENRFLQQIGTNVADRQARRHARLAAKYHEFSTILRNLGLEPVGTEINIYRDQLGTKIIND
jgi:hypothetical protein